MTVKHLCLEYVEQGDPIVDCLTGTWGAAQKCKHIADGKPVEECPVYRREEDGGNQRIADQGMGTEDGNSESAE